MKTRILSILLCLSLTAFGIPDVVPAQIVKAVAAAGTPVQLTATRTQCQSLVIQARKNVTTANTGNVYIGFVATVSTQKLVLQPGESVSITAGNGYEAGTMYTILVSFAISSTSGGSTFTFIAG